MINFEEELKNFKPSLEVEEVEQAIYLTAQAVKASLTTRLVGERHGCRLGRNDGKSD